MGRVVSYGYTGDNLTSVTDPMGQITSYSYPNGVLEQITEPLGIVKEIISYENGKVKTVTDSSGSVTTYNYNTSENTVTATDSNNNSRVYTYNELNLLLSNGTETFNEKGQVLSSNGGSYTYNDNGDIATVNYSNNSSESYQYDANGYLKTYTDRNGKKTFYVNNDKGDPLLIAVQKNETTIDYTPECDQSLFIIKQYTYKTNGKEETFTSEDGTVTTYTYEYNNFSLTETITSAKNSITTKISINTYNDIGWMMTESTTADEKTTSTDYKYDLNHKTVRTMYSTVPNQTTDDKYTRYVYDNVGRLIQQINPNEYRSTKDGLNNIPATYTYSNPLAGERYVYNAFGSTLRYTNEQDEVTRYVFNGNNKLIQKILPDQYDDNDDGLYDSTPTDTYYNGSVGYRYTYNNTGNLAREIKPNGETTRYIYDTNKNLIQRIEPAQYNSADDGLNNTTPTDTYSNSNVGYRYTYNDNKDLLREIDPDGLTTRYVYNSENKLIQQINPKDYTASCDGLNESIPVDTYSNNTVGYRYTYKNDGTKDTVTTPDGAVFSYDNFGKLETETYATGVTNTTSYKDNGTVDTVTGTNGYSLTFGYDNRGNINGYHEQFGTNGYNYTYTYDASGNIETIAESANQQVKYYYDSNNQLTREDSLVQNKTIAYSYDTNGNGNIISKKEYAYTNDENLSLHTPTSTISYVYGNANDVDQLTSYNGNAITYDSDGNMTNFNGFIYTWEDGHLVGATGGGKAAAYVYNASGIRTMKVLNGKVTNYALDGNNIDSETTGTTTVNYVYDSNNSPVYMTLNGTAYYYERNLQGDITGIVDNVGNEVVKYVYTSWGKLLSITGTLASTVGEANHLRYRGYYYDTESGLYYLQSRYYNPEIGRFISKDDPIFTDGQTGVRANAYAYCENNAVMFSDPSGYAWWDWFRSRQFIGGLINFAIGIFVGGSITVIVNTLKRRIKDLGLYLAQEGLKRALRRTLTDACVGMTIQYKIFEGINILFQFLNCILDPGGFIFDQIQKRDKNPYNGLLDI